MEFENMVEKVGVNHATQLQQIAQNIIDGDSGARLSAMTSLRDLVNSEFPPVREVLDLGIVPHIIASMQDSNHASLQFETAWCISGLTAGSTENTDEVIAAGVIPPLIQNLSSSDFAVVEQSIKALGNISFSSIASRDLVLTQPILPIFTALVSHPEAKKISSLLKTLAWTLSNLFRGKPTPRFDILRPYLHIVKTLLFATELNDEAGIAELLWALSFFTDADDERDERISKIVNLGFLPKIMEYLTSSTTSESTRLASLRIIGNCLTGSDPKVTTKLIKLGIFPVFMSFLDNSENLNFPTEICWALSNITAESIEHAQAVIDYGFYPKLLAMLQNKIPPIAFYHRIVWIFCNAAEFGSLGQITYLFDQGIIKVLIEMLMISDEKAIITILNAIKSLLKKFKHKFLELKQKLQNLEIENALLPLQDHPSVDIRERASNLLQCLRSTKYPFNHFKADEEEY